MFYQGLVIGGLESKALVLVGPPRDISLHHAEEIVCTGSRRDSQKCPQSLSNCSKYRAVVVSEVK